MLEVEALSRKGKGVSHPMMEPGWIELGLLASSGAIGALLVWGYQNLFKR